MSEQDTFKLIFSKKFLRRLHHPQIYSIQTIHPLLNAPVVRTFLSCCSSSGTRPSLSNSGPLRSSCQLQCEFSEQDNFPSFFKAFGEVVPYFLAVSCWQRKQRLCKTREGWACKVRKLDYLWKHWDIIPGCVHLEKYHFFLWLCKGSISTCQSKTVVFLTHKKEIQWGRQAHGRVFTQLEKECKFYFLNYFDEYNSEAFSVFTLLNNHHHYLQKSSV